MKPERVIQLLELEKQYRLKQTGHSQQPINKEVRQALDIAIEAVSQAMRYGKWQHRKAKETDAAKWFLCSECNGRAYSDGYIFELSNYCPHCGAKMIEIERSSDNG